MPDTINLSPEDARFMAFEGLIQWCLAVVNQSERITLANGRFANFNFLTTAERRKIILQSQVEYHYFVIAANKVMEYRDWVLQLEILQLATFSPLNEFSRQDIRDLRNMREHVIEYFVGNGHAEERWHAETAEFRADASSVIGTLIGGKLDWVSFSGAVRTLLSDLLGLQPFYPPGPRSA